MSAPSTIPSSRTAHQAGVLAVGRIFSSAAEVIAPLIIVRLLGKTDVGVLMAIILIHTTLTMVLSVGLPGTLSFHLPSQSPGERRAITACMGRLLFGLGILAAGILLVIAGLSHYHILSTELELTYLAGLVALPLGDLPMRMLPNMLVIEGRERAAAATSILRSLGMSLGMLVPLALGASIWTVMLVLSGVGLVFGAVTLGYYRAVYRHITTERTSITARTLIRFAVPIGVTELISNINSRFDRFLIIPLGAAALAEYSAGSWQVPIIPSIAYAVGVAYAPRFAELFKAGRPGDVVAVWREQARKTALLVVPISLIFVVAAEETVSVAFTHDYINGASVLRYYALMTLGRITAFGSVLVAAGKPQYLFRSALIAFLSNVVISVPLFYWIGFDGPALGSMLAFIPMVASYTWYIGRATGVPFREVYPLRAWLAVVLTALPAVIGAVAFKVYVDVTPALAFAVEAAIIVVGFSMTGMAVGLIRSDEWRFLRRYLFFRREND